MHLLHCLCWRWFAFTLLRQAHNPPTIIGEVPDPIRPVGNSCIGLETGQRVTTIPTYVKDWPHQQSIPALCLSPSCHMVAIGKHLPGCGRASFIQSRIGLNAVDRIADLSQTLWVRPVLTDPGDQVRDFFAEIFRILNDICRESPHIVGQQKANHRWVRTDTFDQPPKFGRRSVMMRCDAGRHIGKD